MPDPLHTGCRLSEALSLTSEAVDTMSHLVSIRTLKKRDKAPHQRDPDPACADQNARVADGSPGEREFPLAGKPEPARLPDHRLSMGQESDERCRHFRSPRLRPRVFGTVTESMRSGAAFRSQCCANGWAMPRSRPRRSIPMRSARKRWNSPDACGPEARLEAGQASGHIGVQGACSFRHRPAPAADPVPPPKQRHRTFGPFPAASCLQRDCPPVCLAARITFSKPWNSGPSGRQPCLLRFSACSSGP